MHGYPMSCNLLQKKEGKKSTSSFILTCCLKPLAYFPFISVLEVYFIKTMANKAPL